MTAPRLIAATTYAPSERPALGLPEYDPTPAELDFLEHATDEEFDDHLERTAVLCAIEQHRRTRRNRPVRAVPPSRPVAGLPAA